MAEPPPAEELRTAAAKLRETAAKATPGPWQVASGDTIVLGVEQHSPGGYSYDVELAFIADEGDREDEARYARSCGRDVNVGTPGADAAWIALVSPLLAESLAAWLERKAANAERCNDDEEAYAVARVILRGGAS